MTIAPNDFSKARAYDELALTIAELNTLAGLRDGSLVAVPREPTREHYQRLVGRPLLNLDRPAFARWAADYRAMLAATDQPA